MGMAFETHAAAAGDLMFCVIIVCLSVISLIIFSAMEEEEPGRSRKHHRKSRGPTFVGDEDTPCGGPICRTYLS